MQRHQPGPSAFASADSEDAAGQVNVSTRERERFGDPQPVQASSPNNVA
jgi:hypothetical protein